MENTTQVCCSMVDDLINIKPFKNSGKKNKRHILLIEDSPIIIYYLTRLFDSYGYEVTVISSGLETFDYIKKIKKFDLIFMNMSLSDIDEVDHYLILRAFKHESYRLQYTIPIIANISTIDKPHGNIERLCQLAGVSAFYRSDQNPEMIISLIKQCLVGDKRVFC